MKFAHYSYEHKKSHKSTLGGGGGKGFFHVSFM